MGSIVPGPGYHPGKGGLQDQNNPFIEAGRPALCLEFDQTGEKLTGIQLLAQAININQLLDFTDPKWGNVTKEDIWSYKSQAIAQQAFLMEACAQDLLDTVHDGIERPGWATQIQAALPQIQAAQKAVKAMCDAVTASNPK